MRAESEITAKLLQLEKDLSDLEKKWFKSKSCLLNIEFLKNNITFIRWTLEKPLSESKYMPSLFSACIGEWLQSDVNGKWKVLEENPNCFCDYKRGRALYIYSDHVKYWSEIRCHSAMQKYPIPNDKIALLDIVGELT